MKSPRAVDAAERRARLGVRHALAAPAPSLLAATEAVVALHATDPATVYLSAGVRHAAPTLKGLEDELYDGSLVRLHGMRRTIFVVPAELAPVVHVSTTAAIAARARTLLLKRMAEGGLDWSAEELADVEASVLRLVAEHGEIGVKQLGELEPRLRAQLVYAPGRPSEARQTFGPQLITLLGMEGVIVRRSRALGTWVAGHHTWSIAPERPAWEPGAARAELVRRWLAAFGPGTVADVKWWTGWTLTDTRKALAEAGAVEVSLAEGTGYVLAEDVEPVAEPEPWAALLPSLDPTSMGWQERDFYLAREHRPVLIDRNGNIGPTVWWNGRVVGGWAIRPDGEIVWRLLEDAGTEAEAAIGREAAGLSAWLGGAKATPRFRTPLEKELSR